MWNLGFYVGSWSVSYFVTDQAGGAVLLPHLTGEKRYPRRICCCVRARLEDFPTSHCSVSVAVAHFPIIPSSCSRFQLTCPLLAVVHIIKLFRCARYSISSAWRHHSFLMSVAYQIPVAGVARIIAPSLYFRFNAHCRYPFCMVFCVFQISV